nr:MAG TPA: hypothetical protein [Caudoviricetes sp.]
MDKSTPFFIFSERHIDFSEQRWYYLINTKGRINL